MAKFFQHLEPGDLLGKVTKLKYIDDVTDDMIFYVFEDGTKCNKDFIASPDNDDAFNGKFVMAELYSPTAIWTFEQKEVSLGETKTYTDPNTGMTYEIPVPGVQKNGMYGGQFGEVNASAKDGSIRTTATAPKYYGKKVTEDDELYVLSEHPELCNELAASPVVSNNTVNECKEEQVVDIVNDHIDETQLLLSDSSTYVAVNNPQHYVSYIRESTIQIPPTTICIQLSQCKDPFNIISKDGKEYKFTPDELNELLTYYDQMHNKKENDIAQNSGIAEVEEYLNNEDILITKMIEKSKKDESTIGMDITLSLPPKDVYNTIKNVYPDDMKMKFIKSLAYRISIQKLLASIAVGLHWYYDGCAPEEPTE